MADPRRRQELQARGAGLIQCKRSFFSILRSPTKCLFFGVPHTREEQAHRCPDAASEADARALLREGASRVRARPVGRAPGGRWEGENYMQKSGRVGKATELFFGFFFSVPSVSTDESASTSLVLFLVLSLSLSPPFSLRALLDNAPASPDLKRRSSARAEQHAGRRRRRKKQR